MGRLAHKHILITGGTSGIGRAAAQEFDCEGARDAICVNAGYSEFRLFEEVTEQSFDKVIAVNFKGAYFTIQKALPLLRHGASVIINASVGARKGWPTTSTVSPCKAAVVHLARILSAELVDRGMRVNTLSPGPTDTAMFGRFPGEEQGDAVKDILRTKIQAS